MASNLLNTLLRWSLTIGFFIGAVIAFIGIVNIVLTLINVLNNTNVLNDIFGIIQIWLPFNLGVLMLWLTTLTGLYLAYRGIMLAVHWINKFVGGGRGA